MKVLLAACSALAVVSAAAAVVAKPTVKTVAATSGQVATGARVFEANCQICHQAGGVGVSGAFPRLAGRVSEIAASPDGRKFLSELVLNGMSGSVTVDDATILGVMPSFRQFSDADAAAVLTYVSTLDAKKKPKPFIVAEIAAARSAKISPSDVSVERNGLAAKKLIP